MIQEIKWIGYGRFNLHKLWFLGRSVRNQIGIVQMGYRGSSFLILQEEAESVLYDPNLTESTIERYLAACKKVRIPRNPLLWIPYLPQSKSEQQSVVNLKIIDLAKTLTVCLVIW